jgi:iron complex transport system substrate-binding protein
MDHLSIQQRRYREMTVCALVTAGVESNALRASRDTGSWYEPGTINIILLTNMQLSARAMTRALITATEAKTAALQDLDIRSSAQPRFAATGTGTDNIIVVQGTGKPIDNAGGHCKMGELIAGAVHAGVAEAVFKQNGLMSRRPIFRRLKERRLDVWQMVADAPCDCGEHRGALIAEFEKVLMDERHAAFLEAAMALADARACGRAQDLSHFAAWCRQVAGEIAGRPVTEVAEFIGDDQAPAALKMALDAVLTGVRQRVQFQGKK